jgi:hypothetical protein
VFGLGPMWLCLLDAFFLRTTTYALRSANLPSVNIHAASTAKRRHSHNSEDIDILQQVP